MINRINLILRAKNITAKQFAEEIGIQPSGMSHIMGGRNNPSLDFVVKVIRRYPEIDANWLLLGKGQMYGEVKREELRMEDDGAPTLFSTPAPSPALVPVPEPEPDPEPVPVDEPDFAAAEREPEVEPAKEEPAPVVDKERRLVKLLFFYDDHTFEEFRPR